MPESLPYSEAARQLHSAWRHLSKRRSKGDNEARVILRQMASMLGPEVLMEIYEAAYAAPMREFMSRETGILSIFERHP